MTYNYLQLVNDLCRETGDVELTEANFNSANGFYAVAKNAVNFALRQINQEDFEWPFNWNLASETLIEGTVRYEFTTTSIDPATGVTGETDWTGYKTVDMDSFRIRRDDTFGNMTQKLRIISYEEYLQRYSDYEYNTDTGIRDLPKYVFRRPNDGYGVVPSPDKAYILDYEFYGSPADLVNATDVPIVPENWRWVIGEGAMTKVHLFRGDTEAHDRMIQSFMNSIKNMRTLYVNRYEYIRDTRVDSRHTGNTNVLRVN